MADLKTNGTSPSSSSAVAAGSDLPSVLVVGAGVFGTSTAYHLSERYGASAAAGRITVIDDSDTGNPPAAHAASHDINKIIRADYPSSFYAELAFEALAAWADWPSLKPFYHRSGWIFLGAKDSDFAERTRAVFRARGRDHTSDVPLHELEGRWNGILKGTNTEGICDAYWNPEAGWCEATAATASLLQVALDRGVKYVSGRVVGLELADGKVKGVRTADGRVLTADQVVLATGAWTSSLLSPVEDTLNIPREERTERQAQATGVSVAHYEMTTAEMERLADMPVVVYGEHGEVIPPPAANRMLKFTNVNTFTNIIETASGEKISVPPERDQQIVPERLRSEMGDLMTSKVMPTFTKGRDVAYWRICWDARTPTQDWLLCRHPHASLANLFFAIGGSFHSYKFLPNVGKYMVKVLAGQSNGSEADKAWGWKEAGANWRGAHEKTAPTMDLAEIEKESQ